MCLWVFSSVTVLSCSRVSLLCIEFADAARSPVFCEGGSIFDNSVIFCPKENARPFSALVCALELAGPSLNWLTLDVTFLAGTLEAQIPDLPQPLNLTLWEFMT